MAEQIFPTHCQGVGRVREIYDFRGFGLPLCFVDLRPDGSDITLLATPSIKAWKQLEVLRSYIGVGKSHTVRFRTEGLDLIGAEYNELVCVGHATFATKLYGFDWAMDNTDMTSSGVINLSPPRDDTTIPEEDDFELAAC